MLNLSEEQAQRNAVSGPSIMPLLDVMLLLLIFFLLASVFVQPTLEVDLPDAANSEPEAGAERHPHHFRQQRRRRVHQQDVRAA